MECRGCWQGRGKQERFQAKLLGVPLANLGSCTGDKRALRSDVIRNPMTVEEKRRERR